MKKISSRIGGGIIPREEWDDEWYISLTNSLAVRYISQHPPHQQMQIMEVYSAEVT
jgi:hypothetical protein